MKILQLSVSMSLMMTLTTFGMQQDMFKRFGGVGKLLQQMVPKSTKLTHEFVNMVIDNSSEEIQLIIDVLASAQNDDVVPQNLLLYGKPGCGKTTLAEAIALKTNRMFRIVHGPLVGDQYQNSGAQDIATVFHELIVYGKPCVLIIDEVTAFTKTYDTDSKENHDKKTTEAFWSLLDIAKDYPNILVVMTTNDIEKVPQQIKSRLDCPPIEIKLPEKALKILALKAALPKGHGCSDRDLEIIASCAKNFPLRDLSNVVKYARMHAQRDKENVAFAHFEKAFNSHSIWISWPWRWLPRFKLPENPKELLWKTASFLWQATPVALTVANMYVQYKQAQRSHAMAKKHHAENKAMHIDSVGRQERLHDAQISHSMKLHMEAQALAKAHHREAMGYTQVQKELSEKGQALAESGQKISTVFNTATTSATIGAAVAIYAKSGTAVGASVAGPVGAGIGAVAGAAVGATVAYWDNVRWFYKECSSCVVNTCKRWFVRKK